jgi:segregation and condensation protein B
MKRKKKGAAEAPAEGAAETVASQDLVGSEDLTPAVADWDGPTHAGEAQEIAELVAQSITDAPAAEEGAPAAVSAGAAETEAVEAVAAEGEAAVEAQAQEGDGADAPVAAAEGDADADEEIAPIVDSSRLESILESLIYAADRALSLNDLKRLVNERDGKKLTAALEALRERHENTGIQLVNLSGGWQFRTNPLNGDWVSKLVAGKPQRLSRAMLETLAIVAYRQPITRPEIDEIRGVDCGPVLKTLLDRNFVRILGKKEEVGRPMLYGTTPEFLKTFSLKDLNELPTLREFHELSEQQMATVDAKAPLAAAPDAAPEGARSVFAPTPMDLAPVDQQEEDDLLGALDEATAAATRASGPPPAAQMSADAPAPAPEAQET